MNDHIPAEDFAAYVDGVLSAKKKSELESHFSRCPVCLDELVEIAAIMRSRDKIPAEFLKRALGEKSKVTKSVLHLRLVFEIAASFVVVVFIGYLFLSNNRFWQTHEQQKPSVVMHKNVRLADTSTVVRDGEIAPLPAQRRNRADTRKTKSERTKNDADQGLADSFAFEKRKSIVAGKGLSAANSKSVPAFAQENKLKEIAAEKSRLATKKESLQKKGLERNAVEPETFSDVQMDFVAKDQTAAKVMEKKAAEAEQNRERQKISGASAALSIEPQKERLKDETSSLRGSVAVPEIAGTAQPAFPPIRIEGDAVWTDLRNPELIFAWSWLQKGLALELQIDGAGTVIAVVPLGKFDQPLARQAENEAKKLLFSVSKKKSRRARLVANELPPNPAELDKSHR